MQTIEIQAYSFSELSEATQEKLINQNLEFTYEVIGDYFAEHVSEYMKDKGISELEPAYSLSNCQGDGVAFYGLLSPENISYMFKGEDLRIFNLVKDSLSIVVTKRITHYDHYNSMSVDIELDQDYNKEYSRINKVLMRCEDVITEHLVRYSKELEDIGYRGYFDEVYNYSKEDLETMEDRLYSANGEVIG